MKPISIRCSRKFKTAVEPSHNVQVCAAMFGLGIDEDVEVVLYQDLEVKIGPGRIVFITGESGAGKSCLLRDIKAEASKRKDIAVIEPESIDALPDKPLVDQFGDDVDLKDVLQLLSYVGISEAFVFLRRPRELSDGQRYRFMLARAIFTARAIPKDKFPLIMIDEYLAFLDRETARNVAFQTRRAASKHGLCFVVATTHDDITKDLQANTRFVMRLNTPPETQQRVATID